MQIDATFSRWFNVPIIGRYRHISSRPLELAVIDLSLFTDGKMLHKAQFLPLKMGQFGS